MKLSATSTSITAKGFVATSGDVTPTPDTTAPTLTIYTSTNSLVANETATITFNWSEIVIGFGDGDITTTGGTLSAISGSGATYTAVFTPTAQSTTDGVITVGANVVVDGASNANTSGDTLTMTVNTVTDTTAPTLTITTDDSSLTVGETAAITFTWSETVTGFADADITTTGGTLSTISGSGTTYTATFTPTASSTANGIITVGANAVTDSSGNANSVGDTLTMTVDTTGSSSTTASVTWKTHMFGADHSTLKVYIYPDGGTGVLLRSDTGQQQIYASRSYDTYTYNLDDSSGAGDFRGQDVKLFFVIEFSSTGFKQDLAVDEIKFTINGTTYDYSGQVAGLSSTAARAQWRQKRDAAANDLFSTSGVIAIKQDTATDKNWHWVQSTGGATPSADTGPDNAADDDNNTDYFYFEASAGANAPSGTTTRSVLGMNNFITIPA